MNLNYQNWDRHLSSLRTGGILQLRQLCKIDDSRIHFCALAATSASLHTQEQAAEAAMQAR
eukprot:712938-Amphidinium_carterae.1